jgi:hypothetical protein
MADQNISIYLAPVRASVPSCSRPSRPSLRWPLKERPALTVAVRVGVKIERPGRENGSAGAELENVMALRTLAARDIAGEEVGLPSSRSHTL